MSQTLQYKGYNGSVLFSAEDRMLHGRILDIRDMVSYGGTGIEDLEANFHAAVDEYLAFCKETGKTPDVPFKGTFNVRVGRDLHRRAALLAEARKTKLNTVVQEALEEYLSQAS
jgi:predicted HicB family RNase H-like nuclease